MYQGDVKAPVECRAQELFQKAFHLQLEQKKGTVPMKRTNARKTTVNRQKFSKRKQFVVATIYQALKENGVSAWRVEGVFHHGLNDANCGTYTCDFRCLCLKDLNCLMDGISVSNHSVKTCLRELQIY
jgi:hypothetical protein